MALELETFFELFFHNINKIYKSYENNITSTLHIKLCNTEAIIYKNLISDIIMNIYNELNKNNCENDACIFHNKIVNDTNHEINNLKMSSYFLNNIKIVNRFNEKSKDIIIKLLEVILLDDFVKDNNLIRTSLYFNKLLIDILIKWKKSINNEYDNDINNFNNIEVNTIKFTQYDTLSIIIHQLNNLNFDIKLKLFDFFEKLIIKYNKQDKIKNKLKEIKSKETKLKETELKEIKPKEIKLKETELKETELKETKPKPKPIVKKKKKPIASTIKKLVWNTNIGEEKGKSKCMCCKSTDISQMSFHCGHIIAEANGGKTIVSNLKPICQNCNSSMGITNMEDFMNSLK